MTNTQTPIPFGQAVPKTPLESDRLERKSGKVLRMEVSGRIMFNKIKALLIDVELGYLDFREAMVPYAALQAPDGRIVSVTDAFIESSDQLQQGIFFPQLGSGK